MRFSKAYTLVLFLLFIGTTTAFSQKKGKVKVNLTNAVVVGQMDKQEDRFSIEITLTEMLTSRGMKAMPSLNLVKRGSDSGIMASDSVSNLLKGKGIDTYMLVSVRGYDRKYKVADNPGTLDEALDRGNLFEIYAMDIVSVSFEVKFYREGKFIHSEVVKIGNVGGRDSVLKKFRKKIGKKIDKKWS